MSTINDDKDKQFRDALMLGTEKSSWILSLLFWLRNIILYRFSLNRAQILLVARKRWEHLHQWWLRFLVRTVCFESGDRDANLVVDLQSFVIPLVESSISPLLNRLWNDVIYIVDRILFIVSNLLTWEVLNCKCYFVSFLPQNIYIMSCFSFHWNYC